MRVQRLVERDARNPGSAIGEQLHSRPPGEGSAHHLGRDVLSFARAGNPKGDPFGHRKEVVERLVEGRIVTDHHHTMNPRATRRR